MASAHQRGNPLSPSNFKKEKKSDNGSEVLILYPDALNVIWGGPNAKNRYWKRGKDEGAEVLELVGVYWLEVSGKLLLSRFKPGRKYKLQFVIKMKPNASGWENYDVFFNLRLTGQKSQQTSKRLSTLVNKGESKWHNVPDDGEIGGRLEFTVPDEKSMAPNMALTFAMYEIECEDLKSGLIIKEVRIEEVLN